MSRESVHIYTVISSVVSLKPQETEIGLMNMTIGKDRRFGFFIIGAMKSGSSSLRASLMGHPDVEMPQREPRFFSSADRFSLGLSWYKGIIDELPEAALYGEKSPSYAGSPTVADRIFEYNPNAKLLYIMRNPIRRAISHYQHSQRRRKGEARTLMEEVQDREWLAGKDYPFSYVYRSQYDRHFSIWQDRFGEEALLPLVFEEVLGDPEHWLGVVQEFLGLDVHPIQWGHNNPTKLQIREDYQATDAEIAALQEVLAPTVAAVEHFLGRALPAWTN